MFFRDLFRVLDYQIDIQPSDWTILDPKFEDFRAHTPHNVDFEDPTGISQHICQDFERESIGKTYRRHRKLLWELKNTAETSHMCIVTVGSTYGASVGSQGDIGFSCKSTISNRRGSFKKKVQCHGPVSSPDTQLQPSILSAWHCIETIWSWDGSKLAAT